ncbi:MAG: polysaccharide biosynthesis C-terminal domain-containing protein [Planctomycetota bacterium]
MGLPSGPGSGRFQRDVAWNVASLVVLAASGIALNVLIGRLYGAATLGVFNQVMAAYVFFAQLGVGGVNLSTLKSIAEDPENRPRTTSIVVGSLVLALALSSLATLAFLFMREPVSRWLESPGVALGMTAAAPGLFFFGLNKVLMSAVNGLRRMRSFAVFTALRYGLILAGLFLWVQLDPERTRGDELAFVFTFAEGILFLVLVVEVGRQLRFPVHGDWKDWVPAHVAYGAKSFASGVLIDLNSRVDVWMIGIYMADSAVGIYAVAGMVAEGLFQLLAVLQNNMNPILARLLAEGRREELHATIARGRRWTYLGMAGVAAVAIVLFPRAVEWIYADPAFASSWAPFALLMLGILSASGYIPFGQILLMAGKPGWHSGYIGASVALNVLLNWILIPLYGLPGAAAATALSVLASVFLLRAIVRAQVGVRF